MEKENSPLANTCSFAGVRPAMADLPYPPIQSVERIRLMRICSVLIIVDPYPNYLQSHSILIVKTACL